jgi:diadenosine tetraphosphate (Ap4A) HIT family hydrolase
MSDTEPPRAAFDHEAYGRRVREGPCFVVQEVARAVAATVPTERMYSLSLGSQQGNAHLHWHVVPLPPGVPYERQQFQAVMTVNGVLTVDDAAQAALARRIRDRL